MAQRRRERGGRRPGEDGQNDLALAQPRPDFAADLREHLRLDPEEHDVGTLDGLAVVADDPDRVFRAEVVAAFGARVTGDDLVGRHQLAPEEACDHRLGHHPGADRRDGLAVEWGHRAGVSHAILAASGGPLRPAQRRRAIRDGGRSPGRRSGRSS